MPSAFDVDQLRLSIEALLRDYPDLGEDEILRADMLDAETEIGSVLASLYAAVDEDWSDIDKLDRQIDERKARKARLARRVEFLRALMLKVLQSANLKKFRLPEATLSQRASQPQIVGEPDVDTLPPDLVRVTIEPNRAAIREALMNGQDVPGLFLSNAPPALSINVK
jgi:hypothetical protein